MHYSASFLGSLSILTSVFAFARAKRRKGHALTGDIRLHKAFRSAFLSRERDIIVYLPPGYKRGKTKRYPVLYMHDGQNLFDEATSFIPGKDWKVDETAQSLIEAHLIQPIIIVGIYNTGVDRVDEYTPTRDEKRNMGGKADLYGQMIVRELKPLIDSRYRTLPDRENTGLAGSSLGGLVTLYLGLEYPQVFSKLAVLSPSAWWDERVITRRVQSLDCKLPLKIWLSMGTAESDSGAAIREASLLRDALIEKGWTLDADLKYFEADGAPHDETAWAARVEMVLRFLFPTKK